MIWSKDWEIKNNAGSCIKLGGGVYTWVLLCHVLTQVCIENSENKRRQVMKLWDACEKAKINLSHYEETSIDIDDFPTTDEYFTETVTLKKLRDLSNQYTQSLQEFLTTIKDDCKIISKEEKYNVIVAGFAGDNPIVHAIFQNIFKKKETIIPMPGDKELSIAKGCAVSLWLKNRADPWHFCVKEMIKEKEKETNIATRSVNGAHLYNLQI